jgi:orc1/cdc6 family replication initiation protein
MIANARAFDPEVVPRDLQHRNSESHAVSRTLRPLTNGNPAENAFLTGPSGSGKTCVARYTTDRLEESTADLTTHYVNCWEHYTRFKCLEQVLAGIDAAFDIHRQSTPTDELSARLRDCVDGPYVVVLDEVDQLEDDRVLYDLYRSNITMVLIANEEMEVMSRLDDRVQSRLNSAIRVPFGSYGISELTSILQDRVKWGLRGEPVSEDVLAVIADVAAGDARLAIQVLRNAAQIAEANGTEQITTAEVEEAVPEAKLEIRHQAVQKLTPHQRVVYDIVSDAGEVAPPDLYSTYEARVEEPKTNRTVRNYLQKLEHYNLVQTEGDGRGRIYRAVEGVD